MKPLLFLLVLILVVAQLAYLWPWEVDDAYIAYRYAAHWAGGQGIVYNPGQRIEGYTDFLWVALLAGGVQLGVIPEIGGRALGLLSLLSWLGALAVAFRRLIPDYHDLGRLGVGVLFAAAVSAIPLWAISGLESLLWAGVHWPPPRSCSPPGKAGR